MNDLEKELILIRQYLQDAELNMHKLAPKNMHCCALNLIQEVKAPIKRLAESNSRNEAVISTCEKLIETIIKCGSISFSENHSETIQLSALLNYCCFLSEEFNLSKEVSDFLDTTYHEWYSPEEQ